MFETYGASRPFLTADDAAGICAIYRPNGQRSTTDGLIDKGPCDATPRHGFGTNCYDPANDIAGPGKGCACGAVGLPKTREPRASSLAGLGLFLGLAALVGRGARRRSR
jgi:hypothetical protein